MVFLLIAVAVVLPTLVNLVAEFRTDRSRRPSARKDRPTDDEAVALRLLLAGSIGRDEYRRAVATIAAHDEIAHPVRVPLG